MYKITVQDTGRMETKVSDEPHNPNLAFVAGFHHYLYTVRACTVVYLKLFNEISSEQNGAEGLMAPEGAEKCIKSHRKELFKRFSSNHGQMMCNVRIRTSFNFSEYSLKLVKWRI